MQLYNLKHPEEHTTFAQALKQGLGRDRGLFFPAVIPRLEGINELLQIPFVERSQKILGAWLNDELGIERVKRLVNNAFTFPVPVVKVDERLFALELFHGPTLAFKDFGARFMAQCLSELAENEPITILTATSGDTGAAVADAFYGLNNINVVILYPENKISTLQEKMFCTLGGNIHTIAVSSDFDTCQNLVKQAFDDETLNKSLHLNSANSINISRLLAQICYYFEGAAELQRVTGSVPVISVPSGNFGNLTAGLLAHAMGLPVKRFIAATNSNDTVPRYLQNSIWEPHKTVATISNAMDVSEPSNWPRVEAICKVAGLPLASIEGRAVSEDITAMSIKELYRAGYLADPHTAISAQALRQSLQEDETGLFMATAHPAKFKDRIDRVLNTDLDLPPRLSDAAKKKNLSERIPPEFERLKSYLVQCQ
ncbi:MAG: threonine synthase [Erysipelotrichia bacterium]|nr:threonine synthase [Erysipelotrichia bacterium]